MTDTEKMTVDLQGAVLGFCNPLLDISANVGKDFLDKYGVTLNNAILAEDKHMPLYSDLVSSYPVQYIAGGAGQNSMRICQWLIQVPGVTAYMGAIGNDENGKTLEECATKDGVLVHYMKNSQVPTGTCAVLVNGGERSLIANLAAANTFLYSHVTTPEAEGIINRARIYYITGYFITVSMETILHIANKAVEDNKIFSLNLSAPFVIQFFGDQLAQVLAYTDIVFANESEAATYGEVKGYGSDLGAIALKLAAQPKASGCRQRTVIFTQGALPTIVARDGKITEYPVPPLAKELIVDTNGAGDSFVGGFLAQMLLGRNIEECVRAGHFAARVVIQNSGCAFPQLCEFA
mmetsp:Transcript_26205/g.26447  ORF Transcript_26205/g.26447 Transcript_26205/m.26447 type:complete len:349 (+) Transcript_26205:77-1123(+)|eukprot:CAMPEP_0182427466 /NCGR_PEP_ID=MMETSP1167-20130531/17269_1 /TAXON_ID=2988 /ORGANISM="Mallomonas Sp, Strain CCMP3275" /LENGTH=348 /DNA_ID=CAMNT_0024609717 /DNA_START=55 /DNA_END=1101 /DNA_ORIENTATION=+